MKPAGKRWLGTVVVLLVIGALGAGYWMRRDDNAPQYQTAAVTRGDLTQAVTATGQLNPVVNVQVGSQISGMIQKLFVDFNSTVTGGQVVAQIDAATYRANLHATEGELASARAVLELAQLNERRVKELVTNQLVSQSDYDKALADLHQAEATVKIREAAREKAQVDLDRCTIYSPVDGIVISRSVDVGQTVAASLSAPTLFVIANDLTKMQIDANVAEADIGNVETGQAVDFTVDAYPNRTFQGAVVQVRNSPTNVQNVVSYDTVIGVTNPDLKLKPGMTANISIIIARRENALRIPNAALRFRPADASPPAAGSKRDRSAPRTVYILDRTGKPQPVPVKLGLNDGVFTEVIEGLKEGDQLITSALLPQKPNDAQSQNPFGGGGVGRMRRF